MYVRKKMERAKQTDKLTNAEMLKLKNETPTLLTRSGEGKEDGRYVPRHECL